MRDQHIQDDVTADKNLEPRAALVRRIDGAFDAFRQSVTWLVGRHNGQIQPDRGWLRERLREARGGTSMTSESHRAPTQRSRLTAPRSSCAFTRV